MLRAYGVPLLDLLLVMLFSALGIAAHGSPIVFDDVLLVAWPFAVGLLLGHLAVRSWRAPLRLWPQGVMIWAITVAGGMAGRSLLGLGTPVGFVVTTAAFLALFLLGWRLVGTWLTRRSARKETRDVTSA